ncbi:MAG: preQ(1) synthase [Clostridia bacterium]|jgi:7-cyano-7-deazaguanine reductase
MDDVSGLKQLGSRVTEYKYDEPSSSILETFPNKFQDKEYEVRLHFKEFTSLCPKTGQPDFAEIEIIYVPSAKCVETKSLKLYFFAYRNYGSFMETIVNKIMRDLVEVLDPVRCNVIGNFASRGGINLQVIAEHVKQD